MRRNKPTETNAQKSKYLNRRKNIIFRKRTRQNHGQMIVLMGMVLAVSVFMLASISAEIANLDFVVSTEQTASLLPEFSSIKETFGITLNYNLIDVDIDGDDESVLEGNINDIYNAFNQTRGEYYNVSMHYDKLFDARLNLPHWYSYGVEGVYYIDVTLLLDDGKTCITENVQYSIVCISEET